MTATPKTDELIKMISEIETFISYINLPVKNEDQFHVLCRKADYYSILCRYRLLGSSNFEYKGNSSFKKFKGESMPIEFSNFVDKHLPNLDKIILEKVIKDYDSVTIEDLKQEFWNLIPSLSEIEKCISLIKIKFDNVFRKMPDPKYYDYFELIQNKDIARRYKIIKKSELEKFLLKISIIVEHLNSISDIIIKTYTSFSRGSIISNEVKHNETKHEKEISEESGKLKYIAKEYALAYILDLYAKGELLPINRIDGGYDQKTIEKIGESKGCKGNTFMKAVREVKKIDINKEEDLKKISKDWKNAVKELSENWGIVRTYLISKKLLKE